MLLVELAVPTDHLPWNPDLPRLHDFTVAGKGQRECRLCEEGKALVARQILVVGAGETACCLHDQRFLLTLEYTQKSSGSIRTNTPEALTACAMAAAAAAPALIGSFFTV